MSLIRKTFKRLHYPVEKAAASAVKSGSRPGYRPLLT